MLTRLRVTCLRCQTRRNKAGMEIGMRVVFMGTPDFAVATLEDIINAGHIVEAVVTQPDKPKGRGGAVAMSPVKETALEHGIEVLQPVKVKNDNEFYERMKQIDPDVIVVVAFGQILPDSILELPKYGCINVHASLLPAYRGAAPIQWAVIDGLEETGVTTMQMDHGLDTGDIIMQSRIRLDAKETGGSLFDRLSSEGGRLLVKTLEAVENGTATRTKQDDSLSNYAKMLTKSLGNIDFNEGAVNIERLIRGLNPWPSAFTYIDGKMLKIWDADVVDNISEVQTDEVKPGQIVSVGKNTFAIACGQGYLVVNEVQLEGKKRMDSGSFLRGNQLEAGVMLGE